MIILMYYDIDIDNLWKKISWYWYIHASNYWHFILCWYFLWTECEVQITENAMSSIRKQARYR